MSAAGPVLFYDGGCGLCHRSVRLLLRLDHEGRLRFAPLGGATFGAEGLAPRRASLPDSLVLSLPDGRLLVRSAAVLEALRLVGGVGAALAAVGRFAPRPLADRVYDLVARARHRLFAPPRESCPRVDERFRARFLG